MTIFVPNAEKTGPGFLRDTCRVDNYLLLNYLKDEVQVATFFALGRRFGQSRLASSLPGSVRPHRHSPAAV
jgi:hypothetical protein